METSDVNALLTGKLGRRTFLGATGALAAGLTAVRLAPSRQAWAEPMSAPVATEPYKTRSTFYTAERIAAARANIDQFGWAQTLQTRALRIADRLVDRPDEWLWSRITTQAMPRSYHVNKALGSPVTGLDVFSVGGVYGFGVDPYDLPWKVIDPAATEQGLPDTFPTNDFESFYASALDEHGNFHRELGDPQFLVNELYPERGESWGVDDGWGWLDDQGQRWTFAAFFNHWGVWYKQDAVVDHLEGLTDAFVYTGDVRYAHAGLILLDRIADVYPSLDLSIYTQDLGFTNSAVPAVYGKSVNQIWECLMLQPVIRSYDAFFPTIAEADDAGVIAFLHQQATRFGLPAKDSVDKIRLNVENGILRQMLPNVKAAHIQGNFGMHQSVLALAGLVLDHDPETTEWIDFMFAPGDIIVNDPEPRRITGGDVTRSLVDEVDRDGNHREVSPTYNYSVFRQVKGIADILQGYDLYPSADLYTHPKFRKMFEPARTLTVLGDYRPGIGDTAPPVGTPGRYWKADHFYNAFDFFGDPADAQLAHQYVDGDVESLYGNIYSADVAGVQQRIKEIAETLGTLQQPSMHLTGYGMALLRDNTADQERVAWLFHGSSGFHGHRQTLAIDLYGHGVDLLPPLGYPTVNDPSWAVASEWEEHTVSNNTVLVDQQQQQPRHLEAGFPTAFFDSPLAQGVEVQAPAAYPEIESYRRGLIMVRVDDEHYYLVDVFRVTGGQEHLYSFHTAGTEATVTGADLVAQPTGTYAGTDVPRPEPSAPAQENPSGFRWLTNVARATGPAPGVTIDWPIPDNFDVLDPDPDLHVRMTLVGGDPAGDAETVGAELALADGQPAQNRPNLPTHFRYALLKREAATGQELRSQFVTVVEPYVASPAVTGAERALVEADGDAVGEDAVAVRVTLADGRTQYVVSSIVDQPLLIDRTYQFQGAMGVLTVAADGTVESGAMHAAIRFTPRQPLTGGVTRGNAARLRPPLRLRDGHIIGEVKDFTTELQIENTLVLATSTPVTSEQATRLSGAYVYVEDDGVRNAVFRIRSATVDGSDLVLDLGDVTLVRALADETDPEAGFVYDVAIGRSARIPLTQWWEG